MYCDQNHITSPKLRNSKNKPLATCKDTRITTLVDNVVNQNEAPKNQPENFYAIPDICEFIPELTSI